MKAMTIMRPTCEHLERFIAGARRRLVLIRLGEYAALGLLGGCAFALAASALLASQSHQTLRPSLVILAIFTVAGLAWGWRHRPSRLAAAAEADRQLQLADLLGTVEAMSAAWDRHSGLSGGEVADDPWRNAVVAMADARCATLSPSALILHRLGVRAWAGVGLATALVVTLGLLSANPLSTSAQSPDPSRRELADTASRQADPPGMFRAPSIRRSIGAAGADPVDQRNMGTVATPTESGGAARPTDARNPAGAGGAPEGAGGGMGITNTKSGNDPRLSPTGGDGNSGTGVDPAGGSGSPTTQGVTGNASGNASGAGASPAAVPPWNSPAWPADMSTAQRDIDSGRIPHAYRALVRAYFQP